jgi:cyanate permease
MTFLIAYPAAAAAPPVLGALRDATGTFTTPFLALVTLNLAALSLTRSLPTETAPTPHTTRHVTIGRGADSTNR